MRPGFRISPASYHFSFFFQAEDGIRDHCVTGVQTCALPILSLAPTPSLTRFLCAHGQVMLPYWESRRLVGLDLQGVSGKTHSGRSICCCPLLSFTSSLRSEERRVGKECRSRWASVH